MIPSVVDSGVNITEKEADLSMQMMVFLLLFS